MKYIALLRGINVGGKNKISMKELKAAWEANGYTDVETYINSGNIIFSCVDTDEEELIRQCETSIMKRFDMKIPVTIVSAENLTAALAHAPAWWNADKDSKHNAIFVIPPVSVEEVLEEVGEIKPEYEKISYYGRLIFWSAPLKTFSRTSWSKIAGLSIYNNITIRNANTVSKLFLLTK